MVQNSIGYQLVEQIIIVVRKYSCGSLLLLLGSSAWTGKGCGGRLRASFDYRWWIVGGPLYWFNGMHYCST
ncbi:MAG: hypothetical protein A2341_20490 [Deltaproteobacteria bacterium RIFOXYB12_FULL_58_9]|nr:MAG: hypothetical protein A2341_20490 [Deltaproteobacteria bacterium RIFOXYB12_FULL_58_9]